MVLSSTQFDRLSFSSKRALAWARAAARVRERAAGNLPIDSSDLLIGVLLAHPGEQAEGRALLSHFRLTVRDLLPTDYPAFTVEALRRHVAGIGTGSAPELASDAASVLAHADRMASQSKSVHLRYILGALLEAETPIRNDLSVHLFDRGADLSRLSDSYRKWLSSYDLDVSGGARAGQQLSVMLQREYPLRPADVPTYAADRVSDGSDLIGIAGEVEAFAYLLASKALTPPLAIGLFGDWGSGKSFFMNAVRDRVANIVADQTHTDGPEPRMFWDSVSQIEFNAWQYVQGSLWASLLDHILKKMDGAPLARIEARRNEVRGKLDAVRKEKRQQDRELKSLEKEVAKRQQELGVAEAARAKALEEAEQERAKAVEQAVGTGSTLVRELLGEGRSKVIGSDADALLTALDEARAETTRGRLLIGRYSTLTTVLAAVGFAALIPLLAAVLDRAKAPAVVTVLGALSVVIPVVTALLKTATGWTRSRVDRIEQARADVESELAQRLPQLDADVEAARVTVEERKRALAQAVAARVQTEQKVDSLKGRLTELTPDRILGEFIQERSRSDDYRKHLGLLGVVREDLRELEDLVRRHNKSPAAHPLPNPPPNRIILYIDDLDRCSPEKVLEVLEAVHLLLAFDLFVVVVAVDARWLSHALSSELAALKPSVTGERQPSPRDYLEKIFQLPFWVQPMLPDGRRALIRGLLEGSVKVDADSGDQHQEEGDPLQVGKPEEDAVDVMLTRRSADIRVRAQQLSLHPDELAFLESLAPLLGDTPRRVKRFINAVQLLMAMPSPQDAGVGPPGRFVVAFAAAVHAGLPALARPLFKAIDGAPSGTTVQQVLAQLACPPAEEASKLHDWLNDAEVKGRDVWCRLDVARLKPRLDVVTRLSFERETVLH